MTNLLCRVESDSTHAHNYNVSTTSALKCAAMFGRCEGGEVVTVYRPKSGRILSRAIWTPQNGGKYVAVCV